MDLQEKSAPPPPSSAKILLTHFDWTLQRMEEVLKNEKTDYFRDAALHRFSLTYDLALKCIRAFAAERGQSCPSAQSCWQWALESQVVDDRLSWEDIDASYHRVSQKLKGDAAEVVYQKLDTYYQLMKTLYAGLSNLGGS